MSTDHLKENIKRRSGLEPVSALRLHLPAAAGGRKSFATTPISAPGEYFEPRLLPLSNIRREVDILGNEYRGNRIEMALANTDGAMNALVATTELYERAVDLLVGLRGALEMDDFQQLFRGQIYSRTLQGRQLQLTAHDTTPSLPSLPKTILSEDHFPGLANDSKGKTLPIILGRVAGSGGAIRCLRITSTLYGVASCRVHAINKVYSNGNELTSGWTAHRAAWSDKIGFYATITFSTARTENDVITADVDGLGVDELQLSTWTEEVETGTGVVGYNYALKFNGSNYGSVPASGIIEPGNFTLEVRFKVPQATTTSGIFARGCFFRISSGLMVYSSSNGGSLDACTIANDTWTTVKIALRGTDSPYVSKNGVQVTPIYSSGNMTPAGEGTTVRIGCDAGTGNRMLNGAQIDFIRTKRAFDNTPGALVNPEHEWNFSQNANDSIGNSHLTLEPGFVYEVCGEITGPVYEDRNFACQLNAAINTGTAKELTWYRRFRNINPEPAVNIESLIAFSHIYSRYLLVYRASTNAWSMNIYGDTDTRRVFDAISTVNINDYNITHDIVLSMDIANGRYRFTIDGIDVANIHNETLTWQNFLGPSSANLYINRNWDNTWLTAPTSFAIDTEALSTISTCGRRHAIPSNHEFKYYWDFRNGSLVDTINNVSFSVGAKLLEGTVGTPSSPTTGLASVLPRLNFPTENLRDMFQLLDESVNPDSLDELHSVFNSLGINAEGQSGGCIPASIGGTEDGRSIIQRWCQSHDAVPFVGLDGRWMARSAQFDAAPAENPPLFTETTDILADSFSVTFNEEMRTDANVRWKRRYKDSSQADSSFEKVAHAGIGDAVERLGRKVPGDDIELDFVRGDLMAEKVSTSRLRKMASRAATASFSLPLIGLPLELFDVVRISHSEGPAAGGWKEQECLVKSIGLDKSGTSLTIDAVERALDGNPWFTIETPEPPPPGEAEPTIFTVNISCGRDTYICDYDTDESYGSSTEVYHGNHNDSGIHPFRAGLKFPLGSSQGLQDSDDVIESWLSISGLRILTSGVGSIGLAILGTNVANEYTWNNWDGHPWNENNIQTIIGSVAGTNGNKTWTIDGTGCDYIEDRIANGYVCFSFAKNLGGYFLFTSIEGGNAPVLTLRVRRSA